MIQLRFAIAVRVQGHVVPQAVRKQKDILQYNANVLAQGQKRDFFNGTTINEDAPFLVHVKPVEQIDDGRFACTRGPDKGNGFARFHPKTHVFQHPLLIGVRKPHIFKFDGSAQWRMSRHVVRQLRLNPFRFPKQFEYAIRVDDAHLQHIEPVCQLPNGPVEHEHVQDELKQYAQCHALNKDIVHAPPQQHANAGGREQFDQGKKHTERPNRANVGIPVRGIDFRKCAGLF